MVQETNMATCLSLYPHIQLLEFMGTEAGPGPCLGCHSGLHVSLEFLGSVLSVPGDLFGTPLYAKR